MTLTEWSWLCLCVSPQGAILTTMLATRNFSGETFFSREDKMLPLTCRLWQEAPPCSPAPPPISTKLVGAQPLPSVLGPPMPSRPHGLILWTAAQESAIPCPVSFVSGLCPSPDTLVSVLPTSQPATCVCPGVCRAALWPLCFQCSEHHVVCGMWQKWGWVSVRSACRGTCLLEELAPPALVAQGGWWGNEISRVC